MYIVQPQSSVKLTTSQLVLVKEDSEDKSEKPTMTKEERNLAKMVMPKKNKRLLEKIEYSKRKKASQVTNM